MTRRLLIASAAALIAGTSTVLICAAVTEVSWDRNAHPEWVVLIGLGGILIGQALTALNRTPPKDRR